MLTKNFYCFLLAVGNKGGTNFGIVDVEGKRYALNSESYVQSQSIKPFYSMNKSGYVLFGSGTTPPTPNDIKIESVVSVGITMPGSVSFNLTDEYMEASCTYGVQNTSSNDITISEIALYGLATFPALSCTLMYDRTVLDTPITIPAGQSKQITYTIRFNYGDAV